MKATYAEKVKPSPSIVVIKCKIKTPLEVNASSMIAKAKCMVVFPPLKIEIL